MKTRRVIYWFIAIVLLLIALAFWLRKENPVETPPTITSLDTNERPANPTSSNSQASAPVHTNELTAKTTKSAVPSPSQPFLQGKAGEMLSILSTYNDVPIEFYGKIEDQFSNPVVGAQIKGDVRIYNGVQSTVEHLTTVSDANGFFKISGKHGESLNVVPQKDGYALASLNGGGNYSAMLPENQRVHPDPNSPTIIKMWKLQGAEPLVGIKKTYKLHYTSAPILFDLVTGNIVPTGGDLKITMSRPPGVISGRNRLDWSVQIEAVDGGLIDAAGQEQVTYSAPESGYQPSATLSASTNGHGVEFIEQGYFVQSRNGRVFSKVGLSFRINSDPDGLMYITFSGVANANGSRNWEGDPNTMIGAGK